MQNPIIKSHLGDLKIAVDKALVELQSNHVVDRIWKLDHTVWKPEPNEIVNRLGWLWIARQMEPKLPKIFDLVESVRQEGYQHFYLLGMGGSSLAPEIFRKIFGIKEGYLDLSVLDSTDPDALAALTRRTNLKSTLFIVSTKSGGTVETLSLFKYFFNLAVEQLGVEAAGAHFIAITDPGSKLEKIAQEYSFRTTFLNDPNIGGRYSALSFFGLVPAALVGVDIQKILQRAISMTAIDSFAAVLGTILGIAAKAGKDKATFFISEKFQSFGDWVEQLIAESTGKEGEGILPVVSESPGEPEAYGKDRLFIHLRLDEDDEISARISKLINSGHPVVEIQLSDVYDLGGQFFLWELATAIVGHHLGINPFDQPDVESAKVLARQIVAEFKKHGKLPVGESLPVSRNILQQFLADAQPGNYIALQAYINPAQENAVALQKLRMKLRDQYQLATTVGFGPRYLHSTGQLHKGDSGNGLFVQFVTRPVEDIPIPDEAGKPVSSITFGTLILAQALGDGQALINAGRRLIRFELEPGGFEKNLAALS
jgi:glucose-6-phosphate isomerase